MIGTPVPDVGFHPGGALNHTAPSTDTAVVLDVSLEDLLFVAVTLDVEILPVLFAGNQGILAGVDPLLESRLRTGIILREEESLTLDGPGETLGHLDGGILVRGALALFQVRNGGFALGGDPLEEIFVGHRVFRILVGVVRQTVGDDMVDERRGVPQSGEQEIDVGADCAGLGHGALGGRGGAALGQTVLEVVDHQVAGIVGHEQALIQVLDRSVTGIIAELVQRRHEVVVTEVGTGGIHIVTAVVEAGLVVRVDGATVLGDHIRGELCIGGGKGGLAIFVSLIEGLVGGHALLRDVQVLLAGSDGKEGEGRKSEENYFFHNHSVI